MLTKASQGILLYTKAGMFFLVDSDVTMKQVFNKTPLSLWKAQTVRLIETLVTWLGQVYIFQHLQVSATELRSV